MAATQQPQTNEKIHADSLKQAVRKAKNLEYTNGTATKPVVVERETETVSVIRKAASLDSPENVLFIARPTDGYVEPSVHALAADIEDAIGLSGDINVKPKTRNEQLGSFDCVIPEQLF